MAKLKVVGVTEKKTLDYLHGFEITYLNKKGELKQWELVSRDGIERLESELFEGASYSDGAMIFACNRSKDKVIMLKEFRVSAGRYVYMLPAGLSDGEESIETTSKREFFEETGMDFEFVCASKPRYVSVGMVNERVTIVYGYGSGEISTAHQSDNEEAEVLWVDHTLAKTLIEHEEVSIRTALLLESFFKLNTFFEREK